MSVTMYKIGANGFHVGAENVRFIAAGSRCRQNLKSEKGASTSPFAACSVINKACVKRTVLQLCGRSKGFTTILFFFQYSNRS